jgi:hypothetical protein
VPGRGAEVEGFEALRRIVLSDPSLQLRLRAHRDWDELCATCRAVASEHGLALGDSELERVRSMIRRPGQVGAIAPSAWSPDPDPRPPRGFTPVEFDPGSGMVEWVDMRGVDIGRPFYEEVVRGALAEPFRLLFRTLNWSSRG